MEIRPIKTKVFTPPQTDIYPELRRGLVDLQEKDIVVISAKIVSIHEGNCIAKGDVDKKALVEQEAEFLIPRDYWSSPLTVKHHAFIGTAGVDESNADQHYVCLPKEPFVSAKKILDFLRDTFTLTDIGVVVTDSHSTPMRRGAMGISIGYAGFSPTKSLVGERDLFDREFKIEVANLVDGIAAAANVVMGEGRECQPLAIVRDLADVTFTDLIDIDHHMVPYKEDTFRVLYERFLP